MRGEADFNLAIEAAARRGAVALGRGDELLETAELPVKRRHGVELMPAIAGLCDAYGMFSEQLGQVYVSLGPGSFTGLRIALATVKMLALCRGTAVVGVPTLEALCRQHPEAMVCLNVKRGGAWSAGPGHEPALRTLAQIHAAGLPIVSEAIDGAQPPLFNVAQVWSIGRARAKASDFDDPATLSPLYIREPEAVTLWNEKEQESRRTSDQENRKTGEQERSQACLHNRP